MRAAGSRAATASLIAAATLVDHRVGAAAGAAILTVPLVGEATVVEVASDAPADSAAGSVGSEEGVNRRRELEGDRLKIAPSIEFSKARAKTGAMHVSYITTESPVLE
jgi:hypothetical protein